MNFRQLPMCPSPLSSTAHTQGQDWIGTITVIYLQHALKLPAAADASLYAQNRNVKALSSLPFLFPLRFDAMITAVDSLKWSANWIAKFQRGNTSEREKGFTQWPCLTPLFSSSIPFLVHGGSFFHATSRSLSPNLLCSTWKENQPTLLWFYSSPPSNS